MKMVCDICYREFNTKGGAFGFYCSKGCEKEAGRRARLRTRTETLGPDGEILIDHGRVRISPIGKIEAEARAQKVSYGYYKAQKWLAETKVVF